jgi:ABC-type dipeptide/oligopeptide/nickel transport system permease subunit
MTVADLETLGGGDAGPDEVAGGDKAITGRSPSSIALSRLRQDKVGMGSALIVLLLVLLGAFAPVICKLWGVSPVAPQAGQFIEFGYPNIGPPFYPFTWEHPLGLATGTGTDNLAFLLYGLRTSLIVATIATVLTTVIGVTVGLIAGYAHGWLDRGISFVIDTFLSFPFLLGALAIAPILTSHFATEEDKLAQAQFWSLIAVLTVFGWMGLARLIRGQVLSLREREFVQAAQVIGVPTRRILFVEMLPNLIAPIVISISLGLPAYVAAEAGLSYLGIGLTGRPSLGQMILRASGSYSTYPLYLLAPIVVVAVLVLALNLLGDSIRDAFDPRTRR